MNPESSQNEESFNLPQPKMEGRDLLPPVEGIDMESNTEIAALKALEQGGSHPSNGSLSFDQNDPTNFGQPTSAVNMGSLGQYPAGSPLIADDGDLIEKEWVEKAKEIVNRTRQDPHKQNREINQFKADYLKKRYNKDIKLSEGQ